MILAWIGALLATCVVSVGLAGWAWIVLFDAAPPWDLIGGALALLETPLFIWLANRRVAPLPPVPGETAEEMAANAFFRDRT